MPNTDYVLPAPDTVSMPGETARRLIGCGSGDAALVYLYILASGGRFNRADCALRTGRSESQLDSAMLVLQNLGLVRRDEKPEKPIERAEEIPQYTTEDVRRELENGDTFRLILEETQRQMGRMLSTEDTLRLFGIYDYLRLPPEVIVQLVIYCCDETKRRTPGRIPTMRYIEKVAFSWEREGIFSLEAAESYIMNAAERHSVYREFQIALGISGRELSATEKKYVDSWREKGFRSDAAAIAADRTVTATGKLSWKYMDGIFASWHQKGLHSAAEIEHGDTYAAPKKPEEGRRPRLANATRGDMEKNRDALRRIKEGS